MVSSRPLAVEPPALPDSVSCGAANRGSLSDAAELPQQGPGFQIPEPWWSRGYRYGTAELVGLIMRASAKVEAQYPGAILGVADLSKATGGALPRHRSHQSGRDVDIIFYALDPSGNPMAPDQHMAYFTSSGKAHYAKAPHWSKEIPERYFDLARNWALVKALITDDKATVQTIIVSSRIRRWLLQYARTIDESEELVAQAARILHRADGRTHNDHMHLRIACSEDDIAKGRCRDSIAARRPGKRKYYSRIRCPAPPESSEDKTSRKKKRARKTP